jgi:hypothetical protein
MRVAIVGDGATYIQSRESYKKQAQLFADSLNRRMAGVGTNEDRKFDAVVVDAWEEALEGHLRCHTPRALVFVSNVFMAKAKELAHQYSMRDLHVYVVTGLPAYDEPIIIDKAWLSRADISDFIS